MINNQIKIKIKKRKEKTPIGLHISITQSKMVLLFCLAWCQSTGRAPNFEILDVDSLCNLLRIFYASVRKTDGEEYSKSSLCNIRAGIQRHLTSHPYNRNLNIMRNEAFQRANNVFTGMILFLIFSFFFCHL